MNIDIKDQDIFNFVFFPDTVNKDKYDIIAGSNEYADIITYYLELKNSLKIDLSAGVKNKLSSAIPDYLPESEIKLFKLSFDFKENYRLAADSVQLNRVIADTYIDDSNNFIVRVLRQDKSLKIFPVFACNLKDKKYLLTILPAGIEKIIDNKSRPFEVDTATEINHFELVEVN